MKLTCWVCERAFDGDRPEFGDPARALCATCETRLERHAQRELEAEAELSRREHEQEDEDQAYRDGWRDRGGWLP